AGCGGGRMGRSGLGGGCAILCASHKPPETTGPALPDIAGTYAVNFVPTDSNSVFTIPDTIAYLGGQITIGPIASDGSFTGSYYLAFITGELSGRENGQGIITFTSFGTAGQPPLEGEPYL